MRPALVFVCFAVSPFLICQPANADSVTIYSGCQSAPITSVTGPATYSASCSPSPLNGTFTESDLAFYSALGTKLSVSSTGTDPVSDVSIQDQSVQMIAVGGVPSGTPVDLNFDLNVTGTYSTSPVNGAYMALFVHSYVFLGSFQADSGSCANAQHLALCDGSYRATSGTYSADIVTGSIPVTAGTLYQFELALAFETQALGSGTINADFLDPAAIKNVTITNPTIGAIIPTATITSDAGTIFPINGGTTVPEPATGLLCGLGAIVLMWIAWSRRSRQRC
jgi:hypothetical protein